MVSAYRLTFLIVVLAFWVILRGTLQLQWAREKHAKLVNECNQDFSPVET